MNEMEEGKAEDPKLEQSNAVMASSATSPFDLLPDEIVLKILNMTTGPKNYPEWWVGEMHM